MEWEALYCVDDGSDDGGSTDDQEFWKLEGRYFDSKKGWRN